MLKRTFLPQCNLGLALTALFSILTYSQLGQAQVAAKPTKQIAMVTVDANPSHVLASFDPDQALGSSIDVLSRVDIDKVYTPHILQESRSAGWGPITYRNNTELRMAAWHWTENRTWSDP